MQILCSLVITLAYFSCGSTGAIVEVDLGEPFILNFGYSGPAVGISHDLTKDGKEVVADNTRTFKQLDKLYFTEINELDSGEYHFIVTENGANRFEKTVILSGEYIYSDKCSYSLRCCRVNLA